MTWLIEVSDYSIPLQWFNHVPVDIISFYLSFIIIFFFIPRRSKQVFFLDFLGRRTRNWLETQKLSTEKSYDLYFTCGTIIKVCVLCIVFSEDRLMLPWELKSTFINITGARYQRSHQGEWKLRIWWSGPVKVLLRRKIKLSILH